VVYGAIIVLIARFQPGGILSLFRRFTGKGKPVDKGAGHAP
jgi:branched-chain amino acid transport system permease protein